MRRLVSIAVLLFFAVPFGISISGCSKKTTVTFCDGQSGLVLGQLTSLDLEPRLTGISLNQGEIGSTGTPTGKDCKFSSVTPTQVRYGSTTSTPNTNLTLVDVVPTTGRLCAGTWNRNTGSIPDYTTCTPNAAPLPTVGTAFITASAEGVTSNPIPVFVHPTVTSIIFGAPSTNCNPALAGYDPASNCYTPTTPGVCSITPQNPTAAQYAGNSCISQNSSAQLAARTFTGTDTTNPANNISCLVGPLTFTSTTAGIVTIDQNGLATAAAPGSTLINASTSQASSSVGFFATCPPQTITLSTAAASAVPTSPVSVAQNTTQNLIASVTDTKGSPITSLTLTYTSTNPTVIPALANASVTPTFPGSATITAVCQPPNCNPSPFNQIGLFNNGTAVTSNPVQITAPGTSSSTILYVASTQSQYIQPVDFTLSTQPSPIRLPYVPNSMVLSQDLSTLYLGTSDEIMVLTVSTSGITLARQDVSLSGRVLAVSPDSTTVVVSDPVRALTYLYTSAGSIATQYGGVATRAQWSPDSSTVYITTTDGRMLVHSTFTGWTSVPLPNTASDVVVTIPSAGVYLANGALPVSARTNCPIVSTVGTGYNTLTNDTFYPVADTAAGTATKLAATNDGTHILGASPTNFLDLTTNAKSGACPVAFTSAQAAFPAFTGITVTPTTTLTGVSSTDGNGIVDVLPTSDSAFAFVTYTGSGGVVPQFNPATLALSYIPLQKTASGTPIAPVSGVVSADNLTFYTGTTGDNVVHRLTRGTTGFTDALTPVVTNLPNVNGTTTPATPDLLVQRPRKSTS